MKQVVSRVAAAITIVGCTVASAPEQASSADAAVHEPGGEAAPSRCVAGTERDCFPGPQDLVGVGACRSGRARCNDAGTAYGECVGAVPPRPEDCSTAADDDCDGLANESDECRCQFGEIRPCYSGPLSTRGVGDCHDGTQRCSSEGEWEESCLGDRGPSIERVAAGELRDEDCDGLVNEENAVCYAWQTIDCDGPQVPWVGICRPGLRRCLPDGSGYEACEGTLFPAPAEICGNGADDDCDGVPDGLDGCPCPDGPVAACYTGPAATRGLGLCHDGVKYCDAWGPNYSDGCDGQQLPLIENCASPEDEDCDGAPALACSAVAREVKLATYEQSFRAALFPSGAIATSGADATGAGAVRIFDALGTFVWVKNFPRSMGFPHVAVAADSSFAVVTREIGGGSDALTVHTFDPSRSLRRVTAITAESELVEVHLFVDGTVGLAGTSNFDAAVGGPRGDRVPFVARLAPDGSVSYWQRFESAYPGTYNWGAGATWDSAGTAYAVFHAMGIVTSQGATPVGVHLVRVGLTGTLDWVRVFQTAAVDVSPLHQVRAVPGHVWVAGPYVGGFAGHGVSLPAQTRATFLLQLDDAGAVLEARTLFSFWFGGLHVGAGRVNIIGVGSGDVVGHQWLYGPALVRFSASGGVAYASRLLPGVSATAFPGAALALEGDPLARAAVFASNTLTVFDP